MRLDCVITDLDGMRHINAEAETNHVNVSVSEELLCDINDEFCSSEYGYSSKCLIMNMLEKVPEIEWIGTDRLFCPYEEGQQIRIHIHSEGI